MKMIAAMLAVLALSSTMAVADPGGNTDTPGTEPGNAHNNNRNAGPGNNEAGGNPRSDEGGYGYGKDHGAGGPPGEVSPPGHD